MTNIKNKIEGIKLIASINVIIAILLIIGTLLFYFLLIVPTNPGTGILDFIIHLIPLYAIIVTIMLIGIIAMVFK